MKRVLIGTFVLLIATQAGCAANKKAAALQTVQVSQDTLAIAQDLEANLCWGVPDMQHQPADATHCTSNVASQVRLTDALHQQINAKLKQAFEAHKSLTALAKTGATADYSNLNAQLDAIVALIQQLQQTPQVAQLLANVQGAKK